MALPPRQSWALALSGVLTEMNSGHHDELGGWGNNEHTRPWCKNTLKDFYGVESPEEFDETTAWLSAEGHTKDARETLASLGPMPHLDDPKQTLVRAHRAEIERAGLLAWDIGRYVAVVGWGAWAGYVEQEQAWKMLLVAAFRVQKSYDSWQAFGAAYELGRRFWSGGQPNEATGRALAKLFTDPRSPWLTLPWNIDLGVTAADMSAKTRFKRSVCPTCGAPKMRPSATAYVYCDHCGELSDYDFAKACEKPMERPGPVYENLLAQVKAQMEQARMYNDVATYRAVQMRLFDVFVTACPGSVPLRVGDPAYRHRYVAYMAEGATVTGFDAVAKQHEAAVAQTVAGLSFFSPQTGTTRVHPAGFQAMCHAVFAQQEHIERLYDQHGVYAMFPERASKALQKRIGMSLFCQGWLPMLDEASAQQLLAQTGLSAEYVDADPPQGEDASCTCCGTKLSVVSGATRVVCEKCGHRLDVGAARVSCRGCGSPLAPAEGVLSFACPHCKTPMHRVALMAPG